MFTKEDIIKLLSLKGKERDNLLARACDLRNSIIGKKVYLRALVEFSNICSNDCFYCGLRSSNKRIERYEMTEDEIISCANLADKLGYGSLVLQSGERQDESFVDFVERLILKIVSKYPEIRITLSLGEYSKDIYKRWFNAGAIRYLLRIESSKSEHYHKIHPGNMSFDNRKKCLMNLRDIGYQVGSGVIIGSPFQTIEDLADDLLFLEEIDGDMVGMGPFIPHEQTEYSDYKKGGIDLSLNMIAVLRLMMPTINIVAATALHKLQEDGKKLALMAGANVLMPQITPYNYQKRYNLYYDSPYAGKSAEECKYLAKKMIEEAGLTLIAKEPGDSVHYLSRLKKYGNRQD